jgi:HEAT repeat protein
MFLISRGSSYIPLPGAGEGFSALTTLVHDAGLSDRARVILLVGHAKDPETADLLRKALHDQDWSVRAAAAQVIAQSARLELQDDLLPLFSDKNRKVQFWTAGAFLHLTLIQNPQK